MLQKLCTIIDVSYEIQHRLEFIKVNKYKQKGRYSKPTPIVYTTLYYNINNPSNIFTTNSLHAISILVTSVIQNKALLQIEVKSCDFQIFLHSRIHTE